MGRILFGLTLTFWFTTGFCQSHPAAFLPLDLESENLPQNLVQYHVDIDRIENNGNHLLEIRFKKTEWPNLFFQSPPGGWDWSDSLGIEIEVTNPEKETIEAAIRVDNQGAPDNSNTARMMIPPGETIPFRCEFVTENDTPFWGMRGTPGRGPLPQGKKIDPSAITGFQLFLPRPERSHTLLVDNIRLYGDSSIAREQIPFPFVDRYGQYKHEDWPGKNHSDEQLLRTSEIENEFLEQNPSLSDRDELGAWKNHDGQHATGWFRTEKIDGRWWLISPEGRLFFSTGIDCVGLWQRTFIEGRESWFDWIPEPDSVFKSMFGYVDHVHSMADEIGGKGRTFGFHAANVYRRYGENYRREWGKNTYRRFSSWGINTLGNWSESSILDKSPIPFVASAGISGKHRQVQGAEGYWGKIHDVFDPAFETSVEKGLGWATKRYGKNPLCIGYFVDNELSWGNDEACSIAVWTLRSPEDQPCRRLLITSLKSKYSQLADLNAAWGTDAESWDRLRAPTSLNEACRKDLEVFIQQFCEKYFSTVARQVHRNAPHQLYLGSRFSGYTRIAVGACAQFSDVISFNIYEPRIDPESWDWLREIEKPALIGEYHFGATDRGMFHPGLVEAKDQAERGELYKAYVRSVAEHPSFVGCHWFQYIDEPITGRPHDGENYNIGFVDVTDTPYPELVKSAREVHSQVYQIRVGF